MRAHKMEKKSSKRKRAFRKEVELAGSDRSALKKMLDLSKLTSGPKGRRKINFTDFHRLGAMV